MVQGAIESSDALHNYAEWVRTATINDPQEETGCAGVTVENYLVFSLQKYRYEAKKHLLRKFNCVPIVPLSCLHCDYGFLTGARHTVLNIHSLFIQVVAAAVFRM